MIIQLNGKEREIADPTSVLGLIDSLSLNPKQVAVEVNREIVKRTSFESVLLQDGDEVEILHFVGGGAKK
ncbi:MAG: sulfur carrier protein ThiS [bacterium]|jgi:thiazole synthase|nr:sulfur carrier protein ThiS [bacterium]